MTPELRFELLQRAKAMCEYCHKPLLATKFSCASFVCWKCGKQTEVFVDPVDDEEEQGGPESTVTAEPGRFVDWSHTMQSTYVMNHCTHCGAKIGDYYVDDAWLGWLGSGGDRYEPRDGDLWKPCHWVFHVHHIDKNPQNDDPQNLLVVHPECPQIDT